MATTRQRPASATAEKPKRRAPRKRPSPTHDAIAERAYLIFEAEGGGDDVDHWLRAEAELTAPRARRFARAA